eukprot:EG_transcript_65465
MAMLGVAGCLIPELLGRGVWFQAGGQVLCLLSICSFPPNCVPCHSLANAPLFSGSTNTFFAVVCEREAPVGESVDAAQLGLYFMFLAAPSEYWRGNGGFGWDQKEK